MKTTLPQSRCHRAGFTLVELLVVISIIAILAALLLPVLSRVSVSAKKAKAKLEEQDIVTSITHYDSVYGRFPVSNLAQGRANPDFTYGGTGHDSGGNITWTLGTPTDASGDVSNNCEVIAILMDLTNYPNSSSPTINTNYQKNPQQTIFLNAHMSGDTSSPGVGTDLVYRDPWGNPYIITMDLNYDEICKDAFYCSNAVSSGGLNGLINPNNTADNWQYRGKVMVWSAGPDGKIDPQQPAISSANKDNVLSWQ